MGKAAPRLDGWGRLRGVAAPGPIVPPLPADPTRSPKWPGFLKAFLTENPLCLGCGRRAQTGHHVIPFHVDPAKELVVANVVPVCVPCHFVICHGADWRLWVKAARRDLARHKKAVALAEAVG